MVRRGYLTLMRTSITWINDYLDPPADISEQASILTIAGFPDEGAVSYTHLTLPTILRV